MSLCIATIFAIVTITCPLSIRCMWIQVVRGVLTDFDVVYSPLISTYGSCPGTLTYSPGGTFEVFVSYFTEPISKRMDETEGGYYVSELKNIDLQLGTSLDIWRYGS